VAAKICSKCGYEGRGRHAGERKGGGAFRALGILTMLPFHSVWKLATGKSGKQCAHCGLPAMVKKNSHAGRLAQHMLDVELGLVQVKKPELEQAVAGFGNDRAPEKAVTKRTVNPEEW
jgi:ribosomal protein L37E